jgi:hypothetical protein
MNPSSCVIGLLEILLLFIQNFGQIVSLNMVAGILHPPRPLDLAINPDKFSTILALLSRRGSYGHQRVRSTNQCPHQAIFDITWLLSESQVTRHSKRIICDARRIRVDVKLTASALGISRDERMTTTTDNGKRCRYGSGC